MNLYETRRLVLSFLLLKQKKVSIFWCLINYFEIHLCLPWCLIKNVIFSIIKLAICGRLTSNLYFFYIFGVKETFYLFAFCHKDVASWMKKYEGFESNWILYIWICEYICLWLMQVYLVVHLKFITYAVRNINLTNMEYAFLNMLYKLITHISLPLACPNTFLLGWCTSHIRDPVCNLY